jgi:mannose PTS system EIIA component
MSVGLVIITHNRIGAELLATASTTLGGCPLAAAVLPVSSDADPEQLTGKARQMIGEVDQGEGVLVLTDAYGSTPSNVAMRLAQTGAVQVVAGINLPMLLRILNYPRLRLPELTEKALTGGRDGILLCEAHAGD